jgi:hypothetical protein
MRSAPAFILAVASSLVVLAGAGAARTETCAARSVGAGALSRGSTAGAECMLRADRNGCPAAEYELSSFGVDTISTLRFQLLKRRGSCLVEVTRSFRVVPQKPHVTASGECKALRRLTTGIAATGCTETASRQRRRSFASRPGARL